MTFTESLKTCLVSKLFSIEGRACRSEFWWLQLFLYIIYPILWSVITAYTPTKYASTLQGINFIIWIFFIIPDTTVSIRRIHDLNKSGFIVVFIYTLCILGSVCVFNSIGNAGLLLLCFGAVGNIALKIYFIFPGTQGNNKYGPNPIYCKSFEKNTNQTNNSNGFDGYSPLDLTEEKERNNK